MSGVAGHHMVDGAALLTTLVHGLREAGQWNDEAGTNLRDSGAHFYEVYECADGGFVAVGAIEPQFYADCSGSSICRNGTALGGRSARVPTPQWGDLRS